ncbi:MAG: glucan biosynthesis protein D [Caenispirillum bisanense]|nr:glucan biosynthesis protein D [Caenispirillum bisanense]MCA1973556.1 glucan biosynthesis protein D [Caenispirillum sp.]
MSSRVSRRAFVTGTLGLAFAAALPGAGRAQGETDAAGGLKLGEPFAFRFDDLIARARAAAGEPFREPYRPMPEVTAAIDYAAHGQIKFKPDLALYADGPGAYPATFFHLGEFFQAAVKMHRVVEGQAQEILYSPDYFAMPADSPAHRLPPDAGFAGFRLQESTGEDRWRTHDWLAFLGASYFRAIGELEQYGLSARGVLVDAAVPDRPEEFPLFTAFYIAPAEEGEAVVIHALLDGPSLTGAFRFQATRGKAVVMEVEKHLFLRRDVQRLGIAPVTSMFWYGEHDRPHQVDWRPEVHDSDGLALWTGGGEHLWRPLRNPQAITVSSFLDENPRGFGLAQRDRNPEHFLDGVRYENRPTLWVEPLGDWGRGAVELLEIPTDDEIHDNIGAYWVPEKPARAGDALTYRYRLHWVAHEPFLPGTIARTVATRIGRGGEPGKPRPAGVRKFVVEFEGGPLPYLKADVIPEAVITASRGDISYVFVEAVPGLFGRWRAHFDLTAAGAEPVELRLYLSLDGAPQTETWLFQYVPRVES